jgi:hypothetical protein
VFSDFQGLPFSYHAYRGKESFDTHVSMVKTLLGRSAESQKNQDDFFLYIIAASVGKMDSRMNKKISNLYSNCLCSLTKFPFSKLPKKVDGNNNDQAFIKAIPELANKIKTSIPNLLHAANMPHPTKIYNESTYMEFHSLLCELLTRFRDSLRDLLSVRRDFSKKDHLSAKEDDLAKFRSQVFVFGHYLGTMAKSSAIETHLQNIDSEKLLEVDSEKLWTLETEDTDFTDFQHLKPYSTRKGKMLLPWESYRDWLKLMLHYFDAAQVLLTHVNSCDPHIPAISITIITPPVPDDQMLPWTTLLEDESFFPTRDGEHSGKDFIEFLKNDRAREPTKKQEAFYNSLDTGPLQTGKGFTGKHHCEAYLATLLTIEYTSGRLGNLDIQAILAAIKKIKASHFLVVSASLDILC